MAHAIAAGNFYVHNDQHSQIEGQVHSQRQTLVDRIQHIEKWALTNVSAYNLGRRIFMHSRSLWLGPTMSSCSPVVLTRELDSLEESLLVYLYSCSPFMVLVVGGFLFLCFWCCHKHKECTHYWGISGGAQM